MKIRSQFEDGVLTLYFTGELDHHAARDSMKNIEGKISSYMPRTTVLDLRALSFMDSSGIAVILKTYRLMNEMCGRLTVQNVPEQPMRVLDASGIDRMIEIGSALREV